MTTIALGDLSASPDKIGELVLYVSDKCMSDDPYGMTKLNKLLFFADFRAYVEQGKPITGEKYFRLDKGPAPKCMLPLLGKMTERGDLVIVERAFHGHVQKRPIAKRKANLSCFSADEIALVDAVIAKYWGKTATEMSNESHEFDGWKLASDKEEIPYFTALADDREPSLAVLQMAKEMRLC